MATWHLSSSEKAVNQFSLHSVCHQTNVSHSLLHELLLAYKTLAGNSQHQAKKSTPAISYTFKIRITRGKQSLKKGAFKSNFITVIRCSSSPGSMQSPFPPHQDETKRQPSSLLPSHVPFTSMNYEQQKIYNFYWSYKQKPHTITKQYTRSLDFFTKIFMCLSGRRREQKLYPRFFPKPCLKRA